MKSVRFWWWATLIVLLASLVPMLWISFYTHTVVDDYACSILTHQAWVRTGNPLLVLKAAIQFAGEYYRTWQGSYAADFLFSLQPGIWNESLYFLTTFFILGVYLFCNDYFFRRIFRDVLHLKDPALGGVISHTVAFLSIQLAVLPAEGFFWWNGSVYYMVFYSVMLPLLANVLVSLSENRCGVGRFTASLLLAVFVAGGNLVTGFFTAEFLALALILALVRKRKASIPLAALFLAYAVGFYLNANAPGTLERLATRLEKLTFLETIGKAYLGGITYAVQWMSPMLWVGILFMTPFLLMIPEENLPRTRLPLFLTLFALFSAFSSTFAPTAYVFYKDVGRIQNVRIGLWILMVMAAELMIIQRVRAMLETYGARRQNLSEMGAKLYRRYAPAYFLSILICGALMLGYYFSTDYTNIFTSTACLRSLVKGEAQQYHQVIQERTAILKSDQKTVVLPWLNSYPYVLYVSDFQDDPNGWVNVAVAQYYGKDQVLMQ